MSTWTGILYGFYTNKPINDVFQRFIQEASNMGYQYESHEYKEEKNLLFYKNQDMLTHHLDNGYNTDMEGEGCFGIEAKVANLHGAASLFEFEGMSDFDPYDINLIFNKIYYYVLVVPNPIEESAFCAKIHQLFHQAIST